MSNNVKAFNELAYDIMSKATVEKNSDGKKNQAAVELGRPGGLKGGKARAEKLTPKERTEIAKKAAKVSLVNVQLSIKSSVLEPLSPGCPHVSDVEQTDRTCDTRFRKDLRGQRFQQPAK